MSEGTPALMWAGCLALPLPPACIVLLLLLSLHMTGSLQMIDMTRGDIG